jgi:hypothetical protein
MSKRIHVGRNHACRRKAHNDITTPQVDNEAMFPHSFGTPFPPDFMDVLRTIYKRLFRVYGHIYHSHFKQVCTTVLCRAFRTA